MYSPNRRVRFCESCAAGLFPHRCRPGEPHLPSSRARSVAVIGALSFLAMALASSNGVLFTLSGFKSDYYSHGMATLFLLAFSLHFVQVCVLTVKLRRQAAA